MWKQWKVPVLLLLVALGVAACSDQSITVPAPDEVSQAQVLQAGEYEIPCLEPQEVNLVDASGVVHGRASIWNGETTAYVRLTAPEGWGMTEVRVGGARRPQQFPRTRRVVDPSRFRFGGALSRPHAEVVLEALHLGNPYHVLPGEEVLLAAFVRMQPLGGGAPIEAWADGTPFVPDRQPMYFRYTVQACDAPGPIRWTNMPSPSSAGLRGVWGRSASYVFVVGTEGTILHYDGTAWTSMPSPTTATLNAVWGSGPRDVFAVGDGVILHYDGASWRRMTSTIVLGGRDVWGSGPNDVFVVSDHTIMHFDGTDWRDMPIPWLGSPQTGPRPLRSIWGSSGQNVFAVGERGVVLHYDGATWSLMREQDPRPPQPEYLQDVWGSGPTNAFAVGIMSYILHYTGRGWGQMTSGAMFPLTAVWTSGPNNALAVGPDGGVLRYDGIIWRELPPPTREHFWAVWGSSARNVFAVGEHGTILRGTW